MHFFLILFFKTLNEMNHLQTQNFCMQVIKIGDRGGGKRRNSKDGLK